MIVRIGTDIVDVGRIAEAMQRPQFLERILTEAERARPLSPQRVAGRWAAKEAVAKCLDGRPAWHDVVIDNDPVGRPTVRVSPRVLDPTRYRLHVSISHERSHAVAVAILEIVPGS